MYRLLEYKQYLIKFTALLTYKINNNTLYHFLLVLEEKFILLGIIFYCIFKSLSF